MVPDNSLPETTFGAKLVVLILSGSSIGPIELDVLDMVPAELVAVTFTNK